MDRACELAVESVKKGCGPFGAVITDFSDNIIAEGHNMVTKLNDPTAHAEIMTIRKACQNLNTYDLSDYTLFTSCEPCPMCLSAIYWARIKTVYYSNTRNDAKNIGFDDEFIYDELKKDINDRTVKLTKIKCENAITGFKMWNNLKDKKCY
jgi:tRNA(Arg) A34 adenosine deaminase TadA